MSDFNSLDLRHKLAVISHIKFFHLTVECLAEYVPTRKREAVIEAIMQEANEDVDKIIAQIENNLDEVIKEIR